MARDLYRMSERMADLGAEGRDTSAAARASLVTWMTPAATPVVVVFATAALLIPEAAMASFDGAIAFGVGAISMWAAVVSAVFWLLLDGQRDRILTGCLVAGALVATAAALLPPGVVGLALAASIGAFVATVAAILTVGVVTHESRLTARGRFTLGAILVGSAGLVHTFVLGSPTSAPTCAGIAVTLFAVHVVGFTALLSALEDRMPASAAPGAIAFGALLAAAVVGLGVEPAAATGAPLVDTAARAAERAAFRLVHDVPKIVDRIVEGDDSPTIDRKSRTDVAPTAGEFPASRSNATASRARTEAVVGFFDLEDDDSLSTLRRGLAIDDQRSWAAARALHLRGELDVGPLVLQSLCDPRPEGVFAAVAAFDGRSSASLVTHLRAWLACGHPGLLAAPTAHSILEHARGLENEDGLRLALDVAVRTGDRAVENAALAIVARRLSRDEMTLAVTGARALADAAAAVEGGGRDDLDALLVVARSSRLAAADDSIALLELQSALNAADFAAARGVANAVLEANGPGPWCRRRARAVLRELDEGRGTVRAAVSFTPPETAGAFFAARVRLACENGEFATGLGPGAWRLGWRFDDRSLPTSHAFVDEESLDGQPAVFVPGNLPSKPGEYTAQLVAWRPGSPPSVLHEHARLHVGAAPR